jgi:hypothetical protein
MLKSAQRKSWKILHIDRDGKLDNIDNGEEYYDKDSNTIMGVFRVKKTHLPSKHLTIREICNNFIQAV